MAFPIGANLVTADTSSAKAKMTVRELRESDSHSVALFFRAVWDPDATGESVLAGMRSAAQDNPVDPGRPLPTAIVLRGEQVVGYCTSVPQWLHLEGARVAAYWAKGLMVLPEYRNGPIGFQVLKALVEMLPCSAAVTVAPASKRLFRALNHMDFGSIPNFVRPIRFDRMLALLDTGAVASGRLPPVLIRCIGILQRTGVARVSGFVAWQFDRAVCGLRRLMPRRVTTHLVERPSAEDLEAVWQRSAGTIAACPERAGDAQWRRYVGGAEGLNYAHLFVRDKGGLIGWATVRKPRSEGSDPRLAGLRVASASDMLFPPDRPDVGIALVLAVERAARTLGADALIATASHSRLQDALSAAFWIRLEGNIHFLLRDSTGRTWPKRLDSWWLTRGDGFSDASF